MAKRYRVTLTAEERDELDRMVSRGKADARQLAPARVLLPAEVSEAGPGWPDEAISEALRVSVRTVERVRRRVVEEGLEAALRPRPSQRVYRGKLDGEQEARLIALACSAPPAGKKRWTLRLLAAGMVELEIVPDGLSHETVRQALGKNRAAAASATNVVHPGMWCIPPKRSAEFVWHMEDVLEVYCRPADPKRPVVCLDERSTQLVGEIRTPLPPRPGQAGRYDCEYVRNGVANLFLAFEPLAGWRAVRVTDRRRRGDWAGFVRDPLDGRYRDAERVVLVMDPLNTHSPASLDEAVPPEEAKRLSERLEIHHTPKHGSWLNRAEIELSAFSRDLPDRIGDKQTLRRHAAAWAHRRNATTTRAEWQFTTADARIKLRKLYPTMDD